MDVVHADLTINDGSIIPNLDLCTYDDIIGAKRDVLGSFGGLVVLDTNCSKPDLKLSLTIACLMRECLRLKNHGIPHIGMVIALSPSDVPVWNIPEVARALDTKQSPTMHISLALPPSTVAPLVTNEVFGTERSSNVLMNMIKKYWDDGEEDGKHQRDDNTSGKERRVMLLVSPQRCFNKLEAAHSASLGPDHSVIQDITPQNLFQRCKTIGSLLEKCDTTKLILIVDPAVRFLPPFFKGRSRATYFIVSRSDPSAQPDELNTIPSLGQYGPRSESVVVVDNRSAIPYYSLSLQRSLDFAQAGCDAAEKLPLLSNILGVIEAPKVFNLLSWPQPEMDAINEMLPLLIRKGLFHPLPAEGLDFSKGRVPHATDAGSRMAKILPFGTVNSFYEAVVIVSIQNSTSAAVKQALAYFLAAFRARVDVMALAVRDGPQSDYHPVVFEGSMYQLCDIVMLWQTVSIVTCIQADRELTLETYATHGYTIDEGVVATIMALYDEVLAIAGNEWIRQLGEEPVVYARLTEDEIEEVMAATNFL